MESQRKRFPPLLTAQVKVEGKPQSPAPLGPYDSLSYGVQTWLSFLKGLDFLGARVGQDGGLLWLRSAFQGQGRADPSAVTVGGRRRLPTLEAGVSCHPCQTG